MDAVPCVHGADAAGDDDRACAMSGRRRGLQTMGTAVSSGCATTHTGIGRAGKYKRGRHHEFLLCQVTSRIFFSHLRGQSQISLELLIQELV